MALKILIGEYDKVETFFMFEVISNGILSGSYLEECWLQFLCRLGEIDQDRWDTFKQKFSTFKTQITIINLKLLELISRNIYIFIYY